MRISAISNNQFKTINNRQDSNNKNVAFSGLRETLNKDIAEIITPKNCTLMTAIIAIASPFIATFVANSVKKGTINDVVNFINSENYNKDSLKVKDYTNDGVLDFELVDKDGKKVIYDAKKNELLEYTTTLQEIK